MISALAGTEDFSHDHVLSEEEGYGNWVEYGTRSVGAATTVATPFACRPYRSRPGALPLGRDVPASRLQDAVESSNAPTMLETGDVVLWLESWVLVSAMSDAGRCLAIASSVAERLREMPPMAGAAPIDGSAIPLQRFSDREQRYLETAATPATDPMGMFAVSSVDRSIHHVPFGPEFASRLLVRAPMEKLGLDWWGHRNADLDRTRTSESTGDGLAATLVANCPDARLLSRIGVGWGSGILGFVGIDDPLGEHDQAVIDAIAAIAPQLRGWVRTPRDG